MVPCFGEHDKPSVSYAVYVNLDAGLTVSEPYYTNLCGASVLGTVPLGDALEDAFYFVLVTKILLYTTAYDTSNSFRPPQACSRHAHLLATRAAADIVVLTQDVPHTIVEELRDMPADFGPDVPLEGLKGFLVVGEPEDGCTAIKPPPAADNFTKKWIVLLARYNCSFEIKVRNAQNAGFDCAIVHNVNSSDLEKMSAKNPEGIDIPSVFVGSEDGSELAECNYTTGLYIMVNSDLPFNINTHLLLPFAIVVVLCLLVILIFMVRPCITTR
ncbi:PA domain-containing protein [Phthorimaea operculella]|nr:PA domain-containing protein [Phthorimaea operculella]